MPSRLSVLNVSFARLIVEGGAGRGLLEVSWPTLWPSKTARDFVHVQGLVIVPR